MPDPMSRDPEVVAMRDALWAQDDHDCDRSMQACASELVRALHAAGYRVVAAESDADAPDPNRTGMPKCSCGDIAYRPDPVAGRLQAWRCGGCHRTLSKCDCRTHRGGTPA